MPADSLTAYESWDLSLPAVPARSRLYHLEPLGIGTPYVESLTSYVSRLANAHSAYISTLVSRELAEVPGQTIYTGYDRSSAFNGLLNMAVNWVSALESLTLRHDLRFLTMLTWAEVLPAAGLLRKTRAWCPACFDDWRMTGQQVYDPLLWTLQVVKVCPSHRQYLQLKCPYCHQDNIPHLTWRSRPGHCPQCGQWLGVPFNPVIKNEVHQGGLDRQIWVAETMGDLLAAAPSLSSTPKKENIARTLSACADRVAGGNVAAFARVLSVPKNTMHLWCKGKALPQIDAYLQICHRLGLQLSNLLAGTPPISKTTVVRHFAPATKNRSKSPGKPFHHKQILHSLNTALSTNENPPPSMTEIARRLGYDPRDIRRHFPDLCRRISTRYAAYRSQQGKLRAERLCSEIRRVTLELYAHGVNPTRRNVGLQLSKPGAFVERAAQKAHQDALRELGLFKAE